MNSFDPDPAFDAAFDRLASDKLRIEKQAAQQNARSVQIGGDHYKRLAIQPVDYITDNGLDYLSGNVVKYITRHKDKGGAADVRKAMHYCQIILEKCYGVD